MKTESLGGTIRKIETAVGLWTLVTVSIALFIACFLAKLSLVESTLLGAITAVVIWSTYFSLLVGRFECGGVVNWFCRQHCHFRLSRNYGYSSRPPLMLPKTRLCLQRQSQPQSAANLLPDQPNTIRDTLQSSLGSLQLPTLDLNDIRGQFEKILGADLQSLAG